MCDHAGDSSSPFCSRRTSSSRCSGVISITLSAAAFQELSQLHPDRMLMRRRDASIAAGPDQFGSGDVDF